MELDYNFIMNKYYYRAIKDQKELVTGYVDAKDHEQAKEKIRQMGFLPAGIYEEEFIPRENANRQNKNLPKLNLTDLIYFTSEMQMFTSSGISVLDALDSIKRHAPNVKVALFAADLEQSIKNGSTYSEALTPYEDYIGNIYTALSKTGEETGAMPETLNYLTNLLKKKQSLKGKFIHMSIYPAILITIMVGMYFLFGGMVFPSLILGLNITDVPPIVTFFMSGTNYIFKNWWLFGLTGFGGWLLVKNTIGFSEIKKHIGNFCSSTSMLKDCLIYLNLSHYMSVLYVAYEAGVPIQQALRLAEGTIGIEKLNKQAKEVTSGVERGENLTTAFQRTGLLPSMMLSMIATGEKTGQLGQMFNDISNTVETRLDNAIMTLSKLFEPMLLLIIGGGVAVVAIAMIQMWASILSSI